MVDEFPWSRATKGVEVDPVLLLSLGTPVAGKYGVAQRLKRRLA